MHSCESDQGHLQLKKKKRVVHRMEMQLEQTLLHPPSAKNRMTVHVKQDPISLIQFSRLGSSQVVKEAQGDVQVLKEQSRSLGIWILDRLLRLSRELLSQIRSLQSIV